MTKYDFFFVGGLLLWLAQTAFFGWNILPVSKMDNVIDYFTYALMAYGVVGGLLNALRGK